MSKSVPLKFYFIFGTPAAIAFCLGIWQTKRYYWKKNLIDSRLQYLRSEIPKDFNEEVIAHLNEQIPKYEPLLFVGEYLNDYTQLLGPRKSPYARRNNLQLTENGYYVLTPLKTDYGIVLINRGWIQEKDKDKIDRPEGRISVTAVLREPEYPSYIHPDKYQYKGIWFINDPAKIYEALGFNHETPMCAELVNSSYETNLQTREPEDFVVFTTMPATHFSYLVTWYSLTLWCLIGAYSYRKRIIAKSKINHVKSNNYSSILQAQNQFSHQSNTNNTNNSINANNIKNTNNISNTNNLNFGNNTAFNTNNTNINDRHISEQIINENKLEEMILENNTASNEKRKSHLKSLFEKMQSETDGSEIMHTTNTKDSNNSNNLTKIPIDLDKKLRFGNNKKNESV